jgi:isoquinoline 1-oxidoreductase beta subunit
MSSSLSRRDFLRASAVAGAGLTLAVTLPSCTPAGEEVPAGPPWKANAWIRVGRDGSVTLSTDRSEMGQGVLTALPMLLAEELDVAWEKIRIEAAPADKAYINPDFGIQGTGGSSSVHAAWKPLREAGAKARAMLVSAAATAWAVDPSECSTEPGVVVHARTRRRLKYGELVERAATLPVPETVSLKDPKDFRFIGKPMPRLDTPDKVRGTAQFGVDVAVPGMLVAVVARCPVFGGSPASWNETAAKAVPGVKHVVKVSSGIAVVADGYWAATKGRTALAVVWDEGPNAGQGNEKIRAELAALAARPGVSARKDGNPAARGVKEIVAVYDAPYQAHACMEPMNATAHVEADRCTVWAPTQFQLGTAFGIPGAQEQVARLCALDPVKVTINTTLLGGGFGRRFINDYIAEAVEASKAVQAPVKVIWSREDDIQHDYYRPAARTRFSAQLGSDGMPVSMTSNTACASIGVALGAPRDALDASSVEALQNLPYDIPNLSVSAANGVFGIPLGFWRSVGSSQNGFMIESFLDELAFAAGQDPVQYRRALLSKKPRHLGVLELAAEKSGWGTPLPEGRARGVAVVESFNSYVAEVAEVSLHPDRTIRVDRVVCAVDCGVVVNPDIVKAQVEGAVVFGLTAAQLSEITIDKGRVAQSNFHDFPLLRMREMPVVEVHLVPSTEAPTGIGEPGTPPIAAAIANAVFTLTGTRLRSLPMRAVPA